MARSLAAGLLANDWPRKYLCLSDPDENQRRGAHSALDVDVYEENNRLVEQSDIVVLAVKPQLLHEVIEPLAEQLRQNQPLIISIAAGVRTVNLKNWIGGDPAIVRAMPNTPALVGSGASGLYANEHATSDQKDIAESVLRACGVVAWVEDEKLMDLVTAVSGSGPAYFFLVMEAIEQAAIKQGLDPDLARLLTLETAYGAAKMALEGGEAPEVLRRRVTSAGGTTERAIEALGEKQIHDRFNSAIKAAADRSRELAELLGEH